MDTHLLHQRKEEMASVVSFMFLPLLLVATSSLPIPRDSTHQPFLQCLYNHSQSSLLVYYPNTPSYSIAFQSTLMNPRFNSSTILKPVFIIEATHESHAQASITCCKEHDLQLRVRSGGHDYEGLSYRSEVPFVILDLAKFRSINVDVEEGTAWVQTGSQIGELYYRIAEKSDKHAFPAAWCPSVGVGGMFSGGGIGILMRKYGLAADNILDAHVVDANGKLLNRSTMGEDMFWAIRGGGAASFAVILAWKVRLVQIPGRVTTFSIKKTLEQNATQLLHKWQFVAPESDENLFIRVKLQAAGIGDNRTVLVSFDALFLGPPENLMPLMELSFPELGVKRGDCVQMSWIDSVLFFAGIPAGAAKEVLISRTPSTNRSPFKVKSDFVTDPIHESGLEGVWRHLMEEGNIAFMYLEPFGGKMGEIQSSEIPFPHRNGTLYIIQYIQMLLTESMDWIDRIYSYMGSYVSKSPRAAYLNFRDLDLGKNDMGDVTFSKAIPWGSKYYQSNFKRLAMVKAMVDKDNFFRHEQSIPPLIQA